MSALAEFLIVLAGGALSLIAVLLTVHIELHRQRAWVKEVLESHLLSLADLIDNSWALRELARRSSVVQEELRTPSQAVAYQEGEPDPPMQFVGEDTSLEERLEQAQRRGAAIDALVDRAEQLRENGFCGEVLVDGPRLYACTLEKGHDVPVEDQGRQYQHRDEVSGGFTT